MSQDVVNIAVKYDVTGINESIRGTQRLLYLTNAVRLSVKDIKMSLEDPSFQNLMWTSIQLTRVWRHLYALVLATKKESALVTGQQSLLSEAMGGPGIPQTPLQRLRNQIFLQYGIITATKVGAYALGGIGVGVVLMGAWYFQDRRTREMRDTWMEKQENIARSQGI